MFGYQWLADGTDITGATGSTYTLADANESKTVTVRVSFTDEAGNAETLTSEATDAVAAAPTPNTPATGTPTISGTAQVGETLTADTTGIADADGLEKVTLSYQWLADDDAIAGATGSTYTLADADEGKTIKVQVSFNDDAGNDETLTSAATDAVAGNKGVADQQGRCRLVGDHESGVGLPGLRVLFDRRQEGRLPLSGLIQCGRRKRTP